MVSPGNVRELRNIVIRLTTKYAGETVNSEQLLAELDPEQGDLQRADAGGGSDGRAAVESANETITDAEKLQPG